MNVRLLTSLPGISENVPLAPFSTFKVGGPARYFISPLSITELAHAFGVIRSSQVPYVILGGGSNVLIADKGFDGVVLKPGNTKINILETTINAEAGAQLQQLVRLANRASLTGLEHVVGIPGSVGGAVAGNAGTSSKWIDSAIHSVTVANAQGRLTVYPKAKCEFSYRSSRFKNNSEELIVSAEFSLAHGEPEAIRQAALMIIERRKRQPSGNACAGCIFKNPKETPAGKLIEDAGLKGKRIGGAMISEEHGNFLVNTGSATAEHIVMLISFVKQQIRDRYGIQLQEEIRYIGF